MSVRLERLTCERFVAQVPFPHDAEALAGRAS
jgi:hypothetical protein